MDLLGKNVDFLSKLLDLTTQKSRVIANNIANANTPGYKRLEVNFDNELKKAIESNDAEKIKKVTAKIEIPDSGTVRPNGNNVDIDKELIEFYKVTDRHNLYLTLMAKKVKVTISAIQGR